MRWIVFAMLLSVQQLWAECGVNANAVHFGNYDISSPRHLDSAGWIDVKCTLGTPYRISISPGGGSFMRRTMSSGRDSLEYNLYTDAARTIVWGDGTGATVTVAGKGVTTSHPVYGRIPARQIRDVGYYNDTLTVTIEY